MDQVAESRAAETDAKAELWLNQMIKLECAILRMVSLLDDGMPETAKSVGMIALQERRSYLEVRHKFAATIGANHEQVVSRQVPEQDVGRD